MKKINLLSTTLFFIFCSAFTEIQTKPATGKGLYLTIDDFKNHHLSYETNDKIILNELFATSYLKVVVNGETKTFSKKQVFGYRDSNNEDYRFFKNELYNIILSEPFFVYKHDATTTADANKGNVRKTFYYFSLNGSDELIPLTIANLKKSFPENLKFHDLLDGIRNESDLVSYDDYRKELKVAYLYKKSLQ